ncbi:SDR family oxidoreductase [Nocardiopsis potens]|uniref:SDR family oxidoreductase n=1 Tax=Nocardiopsis potens TaxID=1246458 RepID=UPI00034A9B28|nr:SDR family oxidoreductase [Nocardiopsis potens]
MPGPFSTPGSTAVVTGGAGGIGRAIAERLLADGAAHVVVADLDAGRAEAVAAELGDRATAEAFDVADERAVAEAAARIEAEVAPIDLWCSNAGVAAGAGLGDDRDWELSWRVHVMAHVYAARAVLPRMAARGGGHLMVTASAAGLLTNLDTAPYTVTKHGAVALAEWLSIRHAEEGISVSCLCPQGVNTAMTAGDSAEASTRLGGAYLEPAEVADSVAAALRDGSFLILPHPEAAVFEQRRATDRDRWLAGMRRAWAKLSATRS